MASEIQFFTRNSRKEILDAAQVSVCHPVEGAEPEWLDKYVLKVQLGCDDYSGPDQYAILFGTHLIGAVNHDGRVFIDSGELLSKERADVIRKFVLPAGWELNSMWKLKTPTGEYLYTPGMVLDGRGALVTSPVKQEDVDRERASMLSLANYYIGHVLDIYGDGAYVPRESVMNVSGKSSLRDAAERLAYDDMLVETALKCCSESPDDTSNRNINIALKRYVFAVAGLPIPV